MKHQLVKNFLRYISSWPGKLERAATRTGRYLWQVKCERSYLVRTPMIWKKPVTIFKESARKRVSIRTEVRHLEKILAVQGVLTGIRCFDSRVKYLIEISSGIRSLSRILSFFADIAACSACIARQSNGKHNREQDLD